MPRTVAITGATGFIGRRVARHLATAGWTLRLLARRPEALAEFHLPQAAVVAGSLEDAASLARLVEGADAVVHAAGLVKALGRAAFFAANAEGTGRLATATSSTAPTATFLLISSLAAREPQLSAYAASKRAGEDALKAAAGQVTWTVLRPPAVYGPGDREILPLFRSARAGIVPMLAGAESRLSLLHVDDLAAAVGALLDRPCPGQTLEIDDGHPGGYAWSDLIAAAAAAVGTRPVRVRVPPAGLRLASLAVQAAARIAARPAMLNPGKVREILHPDWVAGGRGLLGSTGWQPAIGIRAGFRQTAEWYRAAGWLRGS